MTAMDFSSGSDVYFEYEYLKSRLDFRGRFDRRSLIRSEGDLTEQKYVLSKSEIGGVLSFICQYQDKFCHPL